MGLMTTYGAANRVTHELLSVQYTSDVVDSGSWGTLKRWTRIATKRYSYVGMDAATASSCVSAKKLQYTYNQGRYTIDTDHTIHFENRKVCGASVAGTNVGGNMYDVDIAVNIQDEVLAIGDPSNPATLFPNIDFDED